MSKPDLIPVNDLSHARANPMIWEGEEQAEGVFLNGGTDDQLALLGTPVVELPEQARLPENFAPGPELRHWLGLLVDAVKAVAAGEDGVALPSIAHFDKDSHQAICEILGEGEVTGELTLDGVHYRIFESVLTGVWRVSGDNNEDWVEVGQVPKLVTTAAHSLQQADYKVPNPGGEVMNAPAVLHEVRERSRHWHGTANHVINFTLLPMSEADHALLTTVLGRADLVLNSGGFGRCRVMATTVRNVWAVQYVNAMEHTILDTLEIGDVPAAVTAAAEDFEDSAERLGEILEAYLV